MVRSQASDGLTIAALARAVGVGVETIRYYQRRGLLRTPARTGAQGLGGGARRYGAADIQVLRFIRAAQAAGFKLGEIVELLELDARDDRARVRGLAVARMQALDGRIAELTRSRDALSRLVDECASGGHGRCPILRAFENASSDDARP